MTLRTVLIAAAAAMGVALVGIVPAAVVPLREPAAVDLHTDSQYLRTGVSDWRARWKRNGWRTADRKYPRPRWPVLTRRRMAGFEVSIEAFTGSEPSALRARGG